MKNRLPIPFLICFGLLTSLLPAAFAQEGTKHESTKLETEICNVCRVHEGETEPESVVATAEHEGRSYGFCSVVCSEKFVEQPEVYLPPVFPRPAPAFEAMDLEGKTFSSESLAGRWILLDFWATWCQPCVTDLPKLTDLHQRYADQGFAVISVSIDEGKKAAKKVARMIERRKATHPVYLDSETVPAWAAYAVRVVPAQFLISPEGQIVAQWSGAIDLSEVESELKKALTAP